MKQIRLSGSGGQGVITAAIILAEAAVNEGKEAVQSQSYGPEARGGAWVRPVEGLSHAEICRAVDEAIKHAIMNDQAQVLGVDLLAALQERRAIGARLGPRPQTPEHAGPQR